MGFLACLAETGVGLGGGDLAGDNLIDGLADGHWDVVFGSHLVNGRRRLHAFGDHRHGAEYLIDFVPKLKVEIVLPDQMLELAVSTIREAARSGEIGDGKIFVLEVKDVIRIRTGETGDAAV